MKNNTNPPLDDLLQAVRSRGEQLARTASEHPLTEADLAPAAFRASRPWREILRCAAMAALCLAALVWLVLLYDIRVKDTLDLVPHLLSGACLALCAVAGVRWAVRLARKGASAMGGRTAAWGRLARATACAACLSVAIIAATPAYEGRTMSVRGWSQRAAVLASIGQTISNLQNASL